MPLCGGGRCEPLLAGVGRLKASMSEDFEQRYERHGQQLAEIIAGALADLGVNASDERVHDVVRRNIIRVTGVRP